MAASGVVERGDKSIVASLRLLATNDPSEMGKVHALWTLDGLHQLDEATVLQALADKQPRVRATAIRLCENFLKSETRGHVLAKLMEMTAEREPFVQQQLALTLGEAADPEADLAMAKLLQQAPDTEFMVDAVVSGLFGREASLLENLVNDGASNDQLVATLARCVFTSRRKADIEKLITWMASSKKSSALLDGVAATSLRKPVKLAGEPAELKQILDKRAARLASLLVWPGKPGVKTEQPLAPLTKQQQGRYDLGKVLFTGVCAACHQMHGRGLDGVAPPLMDSEWVLGSEQRMVRIILHGLTGPVSVRGKTYRLDMPAFGSFSDEQISAVLTYIRREWEHGAAPVEPGTVKVIRATTADRHEAWVQDQLRAIP
ncbi:MAG: cytochrome c [Verrucomicrobia bacterium]|nr:cytochrome c [Verrucomicrobiota bacterium]